MSHKSYESSGHLSYAICSRNHNDLNVVSMAQAIREHWSIEVRLHGQKDVRMKEDTNKTVIGAAPRALACLRNWAIAIVEKFHRKNVFSRISKTWQSLCYNTQKGISLVVT